MKGPYCQNCGLCDHCPDHTNCYHPCIVCGALIAYDCPGCPEPDCPSWSDEYPK